jgi:chaperonin GroEL (HSP60 family)
MFWMSVAACSAMLIMNTQDQKHGVEIVKKAITWPARQIAINAGEDGSVKKQSLTIPI